MTDELDWDAMSYVLRSQYRVAVLEELSTGAATPSEIADATGYDISHISRSLGELRPRGLVDLLVSEGTQKGRYYGITDAGERVHERSLTVGEGDE